MDALEHLEEVSGLSVNEDKSSIYLARVDSRIKTQILQLLKFREGSLSVKYLGLPLVSIYVSKVHCQKLVEKITARINTWVTKHLSYAVRVQLINAVLRSMHTYWCMSLFSQKKSCKRSIKTAEIFFGKDPPQVEREVLWHGIEYADQKLKVGLA